MRWIKEEIVGICISSLFVNNRLLCNVTRQGEPGSTVGESVLLKYYCGIESLYWERNV